ncbi:MAG TPA: cysteine hydrolase family protein [Cyclobacteriaceae bacterium]|nr:cysteine hydrolase family protein [Cyclobacteriaceae bacterium]
MKTSNPALLVIDVQKGIDETDHWGGNRNNPEAERNIEMLIEHWRKKRWPIIFIKHDSVHQQSPFHPGQQGNALKNFIIPRDGEILLTKSTANAFVNTLLQQELSQQGIRELAVVGFVTNNSVEATARMAGDLGYITYVLSDATACFDKAGVNEITYGAQLIHLISLSNLKDEYARILTTQQILNL